jgi:DeoR family L-fucose operon activator
MLAQQRHDEILRHLADAGPVRVTDLARTLQVAEETIRRDLEKLGREGKIIRTHGGALPVHDGLRDVPFEVRRTANHEAKIAIARQALTHIAEGDVIAFDASSTVHELTRFIPDIPLTVVTNSLLATVRLSNRRHVRVISTGGILDPASWAWKGSLAEHALERVNINKLFLSSKGLDLGRGLSEIDDAQARVKRRLLDLAETKYLLVDHSKFGVRAVVLLAALTEMDVIITDRETDAPFIEQLANMGLRLEVAD